MPYHADDADHDLDPMLGAAIESLLKEVGEAPVPIRIRHLSRRLQQAIRDIVQKATGP